ncbi:transposable element Tcb2 transposase [Trichonephila clavipes]|uniref:Transposable element Tcb2 transposase n=1 Tax=Trichonephila clavipes TaxID=2585209 RepID=A0A8X6RT44_TRICX|nr:transposable element Tcb2 transposase [Trichonephila clavipes]
MVPNVVGYLKHMWDNVSLFVDSSFVLVLDDARSRFSATTDSQRQLIWEEVGTQFQLGNIKERGGHDGPGVVAWGVIMLNGWTELHVFDRCLVIGDRYCKEVIHPHVRWLRGAIGLYFVFMDDNAQPHRDADVQ